MLMPVWQRLDSGARLALPAATAFLCALLGVVAWPLPWLSPVAPPLALMAVYYWAVHRPDLFGPGTAFATGLLNDVLNGLPPGLTALLFVAAHQIVLHQRRFFSGHSFLMLWFGFVLAALIVIMLGWLLLDLIRWQMLPVMPTLTQFLLAVIFFPLPCWLFIRLQRVAWGTN